MTVIAIALSLAIAALGLLGLFAPDRLIGTVRAFQRPGGLYVAAGVRLIFGGALYLAADGSRAPDGVRLLGMLVIVAGIATPLFGLERYARLLDWWAAQGPGFVRAWSVFALLLGLGLGYALTP
ncbi:MAG: hypothetical protein HKP30_17130 [Myxococcales bacterium]|nr:hypothetical protein [Myxococcales bacterium]